MRSDAMLSGIKTGIKNIKAVSTPSPSSVPAHCDEPPSHLTVGYQQPHLTSKVSPARHLALFINRNVQLSRKTSRADSAMAEQRLGQVLALRSILKTIPAIVTALGGAKSNLLVAARRVGFRGMVWSP